MNYFVSGLISIPIKDSDQVFSWDVWCSVSETSYADIVSHRSDPHRTGLGPYIGWLMTNVPSYPPTSLLKTHVHPGPPGERFRIELEPTDHPLAVHQREGIEVADLRARMQNLLHEHDGG